MPEPNTINDINENLQAKKEAAQKLLINLNNNKELKAKYLKTIERNYILKACGSIDFFHLQKKRTKKIPNGPIIVPSHLY